MSDRPFLNRILLECCRGAARLFRNNNGRGWVGKSERVSRAQMVMVHPGDVIVRQARPLHAGLIGGSGDLIGWRSLEVTPEMVGRVVAVFVSLEAKEGSGRLTADQARWLEQVRAAGGIAAEVRSVEDAAAALGR